MLRCPGLPLLPGTIFRDIGKTKFHKSHHWNYNGETPILAEATRPGIGGEPLINPDGPPHQLPSLYPPYLGPKLPPWLAFDKTILGFDAYFKETLQEVYRAAYQIRKVKIMFFLEDGTIMISEPRTDNSGIPQGCLVSRQRVPRPPPCHHEFISILDLNVNQLVQIFDRVYHITGCDQFTRNFLNRLGISVPDPVESPDDPNLENRKQMALAKQPKRPSTHNDTLAQFLEMDRKILRFNAYWDDRESMFGDIRELTLYYFLADDTIQIKEKLSRNSGRDSSGMFLRRQKVPKNFTGIPPLGEETPFTVLNILGSGIKGGRYLTDSLGVGSMKKDFYKDKDLTIGTTINVLGRAIVLTDCDDFTKEYYRKKYGVEDFTHVSKPYDSNRCLEVVDIEQRELPPYNGWGSHEDSEGNCKTVEPKAPHADFLKFIHLDGLILRFGARMISPFKENGERVFIIAYYLSDDTISVHELAIRNSGFLGGDFFKRAKFLLPNQNIFTSKRPIPYQPSHFYIGAVITLRDFPFHLVTADEFALKYMENKSNEFPVSDINKIMTKIRDAVKPIYKDFVAKYMKKAYTVNSDGNNISVMCHEDMRCALIELLCDRICDHEIITLVRHFSVIQKQPNICDRERVRSAVHWEIKRSLWDNIERLKEHLYYLDPETDGFMVQSKLLSGIRALKMPLDINLIKNMFSVLERNEKLEISLCDFLNFINIEIESCPILPLNVKRDVCPDMPFKQLGQLVDWDCFIQQLGLEETLCKEAD